MKTKVDVRFSNPTFPLIPGPILSSHLVPFMKSAISLLRDMIERISRSRVFIRHVDQEPVDDGLF
ncbi:PblB-type antireceptor [Salmonella phage 41]|nr:PblB-type antireceptor [Salmonella phage 41]